MKIKTETECKRFCFLIFGIQKTYFIKTRCSEIIWNDTNNLKGKSLQAPTNIISHTSFTKPCKCNNINYQRYLLGVFFPAIKLTNCVTYTPIQKEVTSTIVWELFQKFWKASRNTLAGSYFWVKLQAFNPPISLWKKNFIGLFSKTFFERAIFYRSTAWPLL